MGNADGTSIRTTLSVWDIEAVEAMMVADRTSAHAKESGYAYVHMDAFVKQERSTWMHSLFRDASTWMHSSTRNDPHECIRPSGMILMAE